MLFREVIYIKIIKLKILVKTTKKSIQKNSYGWKKFKEKYHVKYTPTIAIFYDDQLKEKIEWTPREDIKLNEVLSILKRNEII